MKRASLLILGLLFFGVEAHAQGSRSLLEICTDEEAAPEILRRLDGWMSTARIALRAHSGCDEEAGGAYRGRFVSTPSGTDFLLTNPDGGTLRQNLAWIGPTPTPLAEIDELQRLPQFSILLESLLAEDRLGLAAPPPPPPATPSQRERGRRPGAKVGRGEGSRVELGPAPQPEPEAETEPEPEPEVETSEPEVEDLESEPEAEALLEPEPEPEPVLDLRPDEADPPARPTPSTPPIDRLELMDFGAPLEESIWKWRFQAFGAFRLRSPDFMGPEAGLGLSYGPLALRLGFQVPSRWHLGGKPLGVSSIWSSFGLEHQLSVGWAEVGLYLGLSAEFMRIERLDLPWGVQHHYWDAGPSIGVDLQRGLLGGTIGLGLEVGGMPTARSIRLPEGGAAVLGGGWGRLSLRWGFGW